MRTSAPARLGHNPQHRPQTSHRDMSDHKNTWSLTRPETAPMSNNRNLALMRGCRNSHQKIHAPAIANPVDPDPQIYRCLGQRVAKHGSRLGSAPIQHLSPPWGG